MWCYGNTYQNAHAKLVGIPFACIVKQCQTSGKKAQEMRSPQPSYVVGVHDLVLQRLGTITCQFQVKHV